MTGAIFGLSILVIFKAQFRTRNLLSWERDSKNLKSEDLFVKWTAYADNALPNSGEIKISDINIVDAFEPNLDALDEDDE